MTLTDHAETLNIGEIIARWDEIIGRTEAGESFIISIAGAEGPNGADPAQTRYRSRVRVSWIDA